MPTICEIIFDHPNGIYNSGDVLNGHVKLKTEKAKSIQGISIKILGYTKVTWSENHGKSRTTYTAYEQYLNSVTYLFGSAEGKLLTFVPGIYNYSFTCNLPKELPSSCKVTDGKIIYKAILTLEQRRLRFDKDFTNIFTVNHIKDLNAEPTVQLPREISNRKPISGGDVYGELKIPCGGYVPGQNIFLQLNICNNSDIELVGGKIKLEKLHTFKCTQYDKEKIYEEIIIKIKLNNIPRQSRKEFREIINLPNLLPTQRTNNARIDYFLKAHIKIGCFSALKLQIPVTIGTIPITDNSTSNFADIVPISNCYSSSVNRNNEYSNNNNSTCVAPVSNFYSSSGNRNNEYSNNNNSTCVAPVSNFYSLSGNRNNEYSNNNNSTYVAPVSNFYSSSGNRNNEYSKINATDNNSSFINNFGNCINPNNVTIIKSVDLDNKESSINYGWNLK